MMTLRQHRWHIGIKLAPKGNLLALLQVSSSSSASIVNIEGAAQYAHHDPREPGRRRAARRVATSVARTNSIAHAPEIKVSPSCVACVVCVVCVVCVSWPGGGRAVMPITQRRGLNTSRGNRPPAAGCICADTARPPRMRNFCLVPSRTTPEPGPTPSNQPMGFLGQVSARGKLKGANHTAEKKKKAEL